MSCLLSLALLACLCSAASGAQGDVQGLREYSGSWGRIEAGFVPEATRILAGEPLFIEFVVRNTGERPVAFELGGDCRGSVRHNRFMVIARDAEGRDAPLQDPHGYSHGGGQVSMGTAAPGETYRQALLLQNWVDLRFPFLQRARRGKRISGPGRKLLSITAAHTLRFIDHGQNGSSVPERTPTCVPITSGFLLTVEQPDREPLDTVLERLQRQCRSEEAYERRKAWRALSVFEHPKAVDVLIAELHRAGADRRGDDAETLLWRHLLDRANDRRVGPALVAYVRNQENPARDTVCRVLADSDHADARDALLHVLERDQGHVRESAVTAVAIAGEKRAIPLLRKVMDQTQPTDRIRGTLTWSLCKLGDPLDSSWVMELVRSWPGHHQTYLTPVRVIAEHGDVKDARELATLLRDEKPGNVSSYNTALIRAIQKLGGPRHPHEWLSKEAKSTEEQVRQNQASVDKYRAWARAGE